MSRREQILSMFEPSGFGLEIGPSYNPLLPKAAGHRVETIDYADQESLRLKYASDPTVDIDRIEAVDYVSDGRSMREIIGADARYDFILASHVIEHTPDLIGFLRDCEALLKPGGVLVLAVPDKRCCFDVFQRLTSTGDVLEAHRSARTRPWFGAIFDAAAYGVTQDGAGGWPKGSNGRRELAKTLPEAWTKAQLSTGTAAYVDVHVWRFVPSSLELILQDLFDLGEVGLRIQHLISNDEMLITLSRQSNREPRARAALLAKIYEEQALEPVLIERAKAAAESERELNALRRSLEEKEAEIRSLRSSASWRLTRPLRSMGKRFAKTRAAR